MFITALFVLMNSSMMAQRSDVTMFSADSLEISALDFFLHDSLPYLVLLHEQGSSKGEFIPFIERFQKMDLNCLAVDLRNGGDSRYFSNETAKNMRQGGFRNTYSDVESDILAAIDYALGKTNNELILLGAGANGSLGMKIAREHADVDGVIAMSPGEYFRPMLSIEDTISGLEKPLLITCSAMEYPYMEVLVSGVPDEYKTIFKPEQDEGRHGTSALMPDYPASAEYWLAVLLYFSELK